MKLTALVAAAFSLIASSGNAGFVNPGFEQADPNGTPSGWVEFRRAFVDTNPALAHTGTRSVRASFLFGWYQQIPVPVSPYESFSIGGFASREFAGEGAQIRCAFFSDDMTYIVDRSDGAPPTGVGTYGPFWTAIEAPTSATQMQVYLAGRSQKSWIRFDDVFVVTEALSQNAWSLSGAAQNADGTLTLGDSGKASQVVTTGRGAQQYFVAGSYTATAPSAIDVVDEWIPRSAGETATATTRTLELPTGAGQFVADLRRPTGTASGKSEVSLLAHGTAELVLSDLSRGFAYVEATTVTLGSGSPDTAMKLTAAWPGKLATAEIRILDQDGTQVDEVTPIQYGTAIPNGSRIFPQDLTLPGFA